MFLSPKDYFCLPERFNNKLLNKNNAICVLVITKTAQKQYKSNKKTKTLYFDYENKSL